MRPLGQQNVNDHYPDEPDSYRIRDGKANYLQDSIRTNGLRINLIAFKLELSCAKFKRLAEDKLPSQYESIPGGVGHYLIEIRNVVRSKEDVVMLWPIGRPEDTKVLCLDLGQACVVGGHAYIPPRATPIRRRQSEKKFCAANKCRKDRIASSTIIASSSTMIDPISSVTSTISPSISTTPNNTSTSGVSLPASLSAQAATSTATLLRCQAAYWSATGSSKDRLAANFSTPTMNGGSKGPRSSWKD